MCTHSPKEVRSDPPCYGFIAQLLERRSDQEELTVTLSSQILTETRSQVDRAPMASASAQDRVSFASGLARSEERRAMDETALQTHGNLLCVI